MSPFQACAGTAFEKLKTKQGNQPCSPFDILLPHDSIAPSLNKSTTPSNASKFCFIGSTTPLLIKAQEPCLLSWDIMGLCFWNLCKPHCLQFYSTLTSVPQHCMDGPHAPHTVCHWQNTTSTAASKSWCETARPSKILQNSAK